MPPTSRVPYFSWEPTSRLVSMAIVELFDTIVMIGMPLRTAVSKSRPVMPNAASPIQLMQTLSGSASFAPIAKPSPVPSAWDLPQPM
ncbi:MAG: hypothetical protein F4X54_05925 [Chloroflexi bacterium]|nr:hypothetical protein [Chloroflexota bacterium]